MKAIDRMKRRLRRPMATRTARYAPSERPRGGIKDNRQRVADFRHRLDQHLSDGNRPQLHRMK